MTNAILDYDEFGAEEFERKIAEIVGDYDGGYAPYTAGGVKFSLATDVASILEEYDTEGVKYGSILDVADAIEGLIAESAEDTTELENILNDFRAAQDDARRWGNRMDSGGEEEFEEALRAYASQSEVRYNLSNPYGGNSGYVGYSMSKRAAEAREEGRYPKSDFKKVYDMPQATLDALVNAGVINDKEWHHTSVYGNETTFYGWGTYGESPYMSEYYKTHKTEIDEAAKSHGDLTPFLDGFEEFEANVDANDSFIAQLKAQAEAEREAQRREEERLFQKRIDEAKREVEDSERKRAYVEANLPVEFVASNGVTIKPKGYGEYPAYRDGEAITSASSSNKRKAASKARAEFKEQIIAPLEGTYASQSKVRHSLRDIPAYEASAELSVMLGGYKSKQITLNGLVKAVENIAKKYSKTGLLETAIEEYDNGDTKEFINALKGFVSVYPPTMLRDYSGDKATIEETFGGIWIDDTEEFAKFVSAVNTYPTDENGEGIAKTSDYLYLYYRGIGERIIPFVSVYLNKNESQNVANELINVWNNGEKGKVREYIDGAYEVARDVNVQGNILDGTDKELSATRGNDRLGSELSQLGRYYYTPELYSKVKRADSGSRGRGKVNYSLITPEMDASYLDAVERGDMETAQRMVLEAAEKVGYINDESWRKSHRAPRKDEENANPFNTEKIVPEDFWEHPEWYTNIRHSSETRESYYAMKRAIDKYKRLMAEGKTDEADNVTITMYRGVDKTANKREASFRNGDWITPSRSYALLSAPYGKARVISQEVKLKDIWWDGNSINEWGYDDGANYGYRDTKNNRKLLDPVTYDDNGNVILLSERFNPKKEDIRYSMPSPESAIEAENIAILRNRAETMWAEPMDMEDAEKEEYILSETGWLHTDGGWMYLGAHSSRVFDMSKVQI